MDRERWQQVDELLAAALARPAAGREAFLADACGDDAALRSEVASLLAHTVDDEFLATPVAAELGDVLASNGETLVGQRLGRFEVVAKLGAGGMGEIYLALDPRLERQVALKRVPRLLADDPERVRRFRREALAVTALNHPNILTVHEIVDTEEGDVLVSELVDGVTLRARLRTGPLPPAEALDMAVQVGRGLAAAHAAGIVHRDVKPENVMIRNDGLVKVLDFGVAKSVQAAIAVEDAETGTTPGEIVGTIGYMSPEQARGLPVDARSDVWSLGVLLHEALTGSSPFPGATPSDRLAAILRADPEPPSRHLPGLPPAIDRLLARALSKERDDRHRDAGELVADLEAVRAAVASRGTGAGEKRFARRRLALPRSRRARAAVALAALVLAAGGVFAGRRLLLPPAVESIAVLPLVNAGGEPSLDYLGEGIADSLIRTLAPTPRLRVISRLSSFRYQGEAAEAGRVGRELGVRTVLAGQVLPRGDTLTVDVELIDANDRAQLWGKQYRLSSTQLPTLHEEIAREVRERLERPLPRARGTAGLAAPHTPQPQAYDLYLQGRYHWNRTSAPSFHASRDLFQRAIEADPDYALAWSGLSHYYSFGAANGLLDPTQHWSRAEQTTRRALQLDPRQPEIYNNLAGMAAYRDRNWAEAERHFVDGLALGVSPELLRHYSFFLGMIGRLEDARRVAADLGAILPRSPGALDRHGRTLYNNRAFLEAVATFEESLALEPGNSATREALGDALAQLGREKEAVVAWRQALLDADRAELANELASTYAEAGYAAARAALARRRLADLRQRAESGAYVSAHAFARQHLLAGDREQALRWATKAFAERNRLVLELAIDPLFDPLRDDPQFRAGVASLGLPPTVAAATARRAH
jgi:eukaryotic-like serine/threonine-protein kinase